MCKNCFISLVATYFLIFSLLYALGSSVNIWLYSLIITILLSVAVIACPMHKEAWKCCTTTKSVKKVVKKPLKKKK